MNAFRRNVAAARTYAELEKVVQGSDWPIGIDGVYAHRTRRGPAHAKRSGSTAKLASIVGNPVILSQMVQHVPDAGSYAPAMIRIDERPDGVDLS
jgi:hypothetical protein